MYNKDYIIIIIMYSVVNETYSQLSTSVSKTKILIKVRDYYEIVKLQNAKQ